MNHLLHTLFIIVALLCTPAMAAQSDTSADPQPADVTATTTMEETAVPSDTAAVQASPSLKAVCVPSDEAYKLTPEWRRSRTLRTLGWTSLGVGTAMVAGGFGWLTAVIISDKSNDADRVGISTLLVTGSTLMLATAPLLIMSHVYKKRAKAAVQLSLSASAIAEPLSGATGWSSRPGIGFTLTF